MERGRYSKGSIGGRNESLFMNRRNQRGLGVAHLEHLRLQNLSTRGVITMPSSHQNAHPTPTVNESHLENSTSSRVLVFVEHEPLKLLPLFEPPKEEWGYWKKLNDEKTGASMIPSSVNINIVENNQRNEDSVCKCQKIDLDLKLSL